MACYYFLAILPIFLTLLSPKLVLAQAPGPDTPSGPANLTGILDKNQQFTVFIRLLIANQVATQIESQLNSSTQGLTVFAPTDNAFNSLKAGTLNNLTTQQQVQLLLYHVVPQFYTLNTLLTVSNPVRTQASGQDGGSWGLNFTGQGTQVNVSTGIVETQINNVLNKEFPLALYQVDKVLLPSELFGPHHAAPPPPPKAKTPPVSSSNTTDESPAPSSKNDSSGSNGGNVGFGMVLGFGIICMSVLVF